MIRLEGEDGPGGLEAWLVKEMDSCLCSIFLNQDQDAFIQLFNLILYENVNGGRPVPAAPPLRARTLDLSAPASALQ